jgi:hypothetical protein
LTGAAAIYKPQNTGFRVYIASPMGKKIDLVAKPYSH